MKTLIMIAGAAVLTTYISTGMAAAAKVPETMVRPGPPTVSALPSGVYVIDKTHGYVVFSYSHQGYSRPILTFHGVDATLEIDSKDPTKSSVEATIDAASVSTGVPVWDERIQNDQFFNTAAFPKITFKSTAISLSDSAHGTMSGDLIIRGVKKPVTFDVTLNKIGKHFQSGAPWLGVSATGTVLRSDWGISYAVPVTSDEVDIRLEAEFGLKGGDR